MRRRIVAVALPHLGAEARLRREGLQGLGRPFALAGQSGSALRLVSVDPAAAAAGLSPGVGLTDARALCPGLVTRPTEPERQAAFLATLARWAARFSPLVGLAEEETLVLDITGCAHLFGGEAAMLARIEAELARLGLTGRGAIADTKGAAWALAHHGRAERIAAPGRSRAAIGALPVAALRIAAEAAEGLAGLGLGTVEATARLPRGQLARRFGIETVRRLDQALGAEPEPVTPARPPARFAARLTLPEPVGLLSDLEAGLERLLERVCASLEREAMGARRLRLIARRVDGADEAAEIALARPGRDPMRIRGLFAPRLEAIDAGWGIDALRLVVTEAEPLRPAQVSAGREREGEALADLLSRLGNRIGFERVIRVLPAESHIPERSFTLASAAWEAPRSWPPDGPPRPLTLFRPEPLVEVAPGPPRRPPPRFRWRGRTFRLAAATGPERLAPEWWWDDPEWRTGVRDYWRAQTAEGPRLWLFHTPAAGRPAWWAQGAFA